MKRLSYNDFKLIEQDISSKIIGCRINNISLVNSRDYVLNLSMIKDEKLLISLNHSCPFASLANLSNTPPTIVGNMNDNLRKYVRDAFIVNVSLFNQDRVFCFELQKANDLYEKEKFFLYVECIPQRPNLVICNDKNIVIFAAHYSSLTSTRVIVKNLEYQPLNSNLKVNNEETTSLDEIKKEVQKYYLDSLNVRDKEKFEELFKFIRIRIKSLTKKLATLDNAILEAKDKLHYSDIGSCILGYSYSPEDLENYIKENNIEYDNKLSAGQNAEKYFKKYKKAKRTIEMNEIEKQKAKEEINHLNFVLTSSTYMHEEELIALAKQLVPNKYKSLKLKKEPNFIGSVIVENSKIFFGKNAKANNELTFKLSNKSDTYVHIKDMHGSHVVIHNKKPSNEQLLVAAEIALILSNQVAGEVYYTEIKNVKKGSSLGEANLLSYKTITLKSVRDSTKVLLNK